MAFLYRITELHGDSESQHQNEFMSENPHVNLSMILTFWVLRTFGATHPRYILMVFVLAFAHSNLSWCDVVLCHSYSRTGAHQCKHHNNIIQDKCVMRTLFSHVHSAPRGARTSWRPSAWPSTQGSCLSTRPRSLGPELDSCPLVHGHQPASKLHN